MAKIRLQLKKGTQNWNRASHAKCVVDARLTTSLIIFCTRIQKLLRAHLEEAGWVDDLKDLAKGEKKDERSKIYD